MDPLRELAVAARAALVLPTVSAVSTADAAFDLWVRQASPALLRFASATGSADAADLVQDALVAVFTRWSRLSGPGAASAYARRVIVNGRVSRWRSWGRRMSNVDPAVLMESVTADVTPGSDEVVVARRLLKGLPPTQAAAVFLRFYDDLTYREIAKVIGCREATARSYVHRALHQLKAQLDEVSAT